MFVVFQPCQRTTGVKTSSSSATTNGSGSASSQLKAVASQALNDKGRTYTPPGTTIRAVSSSSTSNNMSLPGTPVLAPGGGQIPASMMGPGTAQLGGRSTLVRSVNVSQLANQQEVSGHIITLPASVRQKINVNAALNIRVNNQNILVPPSCLISTPDGIKVFLPPGIVPNAQQDPAQTSVTPPPSTSARPINLMTNAQNPQNLTVKNQQSIHSSVPPPIVIPDVKTVDKANVKISKKQTKGINPSLCHFKKIHGGFDCMLNIFKCLSVAELSR